MVALYLSLALAALLCHVCVGDELAANQLLEFLNEHRVPEGILSTTWGKPVSYNEANYGLYRDESIVLNHYLYESISSLARERLPFRAVHAKGCGAHGYFEVTHDVTNITNVKMFNKIGKRTPVFVRFSPTAGEPGNPELINRNKGVGIKFYTEEGNMDVTGFNFNGFPVKDPIHVSSFVHSIKKNPKTGVPDINHAYDFIVNHPEALLASIQTLTPIGQPRSYANIPFFAVHTYQVEKDKDHVNFIKINWTPDAGFDNLTNAELVALRGSSPDYHMIELYNRISQGNYPTYTLTFQVIPYVDMAKVPFDIFDMSMHWPADQFPHIPVGKIVLNRNPENHQAEVEMSAFNPGNLVPGILGLDKVFEARTIIYREGALHRLGSGFNKIKINCPINPPLTYSRDGDAPVETNGGGAPNYYPNSFNGIVPVNMTYAPRYRPNTQPGVHNYWLVKKFVNDLSEADRTALYNNMALSLTNVMPSIRENIIKIWKDIDTTMAARLQAIVNAILASEASS